MTDKYYDIYFDPADLEVDTEGRLLNLDILQIIEFEYDDVTDTVDVCRRVNEKGEVIQNDPDLTDLEHVGDGDDPTISKALGRFEGWLDNHLDWKEDVAETRYQPAEYICIGIEGYVDEPPYRPHHISDTVIRAILKRRR